MHYLGKENQLFPFLEKRGFSHPSTIMWGLHDKIRRLTKLYRAILDIRDEQKAIALLKNHQYRILNGNIRPQLEQPKKPTIAERQNLFHLQEPIYLVHG